MPINDQHRAGLSVTTFIMLCVWLGPRLACSLLFVIGVGAVWFLACRRWPIVAIFTAGVVRGLLRR